MTIQQLSSSRRKFFRRGVATGVGALAAIGSVGRASAANEKALHLVSDARRKAVIAIQHAERSLDDAKRLKNIIDEAVESESEKRFAAEYADRLYTYVSHLKNLDFNIHILGLEISQNC